MLRIRLMLDFLHDSRYTIFVGIMGFVYCKVLLRISRHYVLKRVDKKRMAEEGLVAIHERDVLASLDSSFIVKLSAFREDARDAFLLLEACAGGDLHDAFRHVRWWGDADASRFYLANVVEGLRHMHSRRCIWRDAKLDNVCLDASGFGKLIDMGCARMMDVICSRTLTTTPSRLSAIGASAGLASSAAAPDAV